MDIGILVIGDELTSGMTLDTNSSFIARESQMQGWHVSSVMTVGDDGDAIKGGLDYLLGDLRCAGCHGRARSDCG